MVVVFASDRDGVPAALVDGYLPSADDMQELLVLARSFKYPGIDNHPRDSRYTFIGISQMISDYLRNLQGGVPDHWVIYPYSSQHRLETCTLRDSALGVLLNSPELKNERVHQTPYCVSVIAEPEARSWSRLRNYIPVWQAASRLRSKEQTSYANLGRFEANCQNVLRHLQHTYVDPAEPGFLTESGLEFCSVWKVS